MHVGCVLPGFVATEGFPQRELVARSLTRWLVSSPDKVADAIGTAGRAGRPSATCRAPTRCWPRPRRAVAPAPWSGAR